MNTAEQRTRAEIDGLKANWKADPCWDIEDTETFEAHREELVAFHEQMRGQWAAEMRAKLEAKAVELGIPGNTTLAAYILRLEKRIADMEPYVYGG